jgi:hypothetical protein
MKLKPQAMGRPLKNKSQQSCKNWFLLKKVQLHTFYN